jgi:hypothetical protein
MRDGVLGRHCGIVLGDSTSYGLFVHGEGVYLRDYREDASCIALYRRAMYNKEVARTIKQELSSPDITGLMFLIFAC